MKGIRNFIIVTYAIIAIFATVCLLSYNQFKVTEIGEYSLILVDSEELEPNFQKGDLVIVDASKKVRIGDQVFFYNTYDKNVSVSIAKITNQQKVTSNEITYTLEGDKALSSDYVIGPVNGVSRMPKVGSVLRILESKWGFLFLIVFPSFLAFLYEIAEIIAEIRKKD